MNNNNTYMHLTNVYRHPLKFFFIVSDNDLHGDVKGFEKIHGYKPKAFRKYYKNKI